MDEELFEKMVRENGTTGLSIRYTTLEDAPYLKEWLLNPEVLLGFPMEGEAEIQDAVMRWISFHRIQSSITVEVNGVPAGIATLYLQAYQKLVKQSEFGIIVGPQ